MSRLPAKTKGPIGVHLTGHVEANDRPAIVPDANTGTAVVVPALDRPRSLKLLRFPAVRERTGLSRSTIWRLEREGEFPKHRRISSNAVAWVEDEVLSWIHSKIADVAV
jgi:prophage regulatory protein